MQCCCRRTSLKPHSLEVESALPKYDPFEDYLEQLVLYGYVTLFVVAFPLAPLLGLINNLVEIRVDSFKLLYNCARPIPQGAQHIGIPYSIVVRVVQMLVNVVFPQALGEHFLT